MKKRIFYLIGLLVVFTFNYLIKAHYDLELAERLNEINFFTIIDHALNPVGVFLLLKFFINKYWTTKTFTLFYLVIMILELTIGYYNGKNIIDYNYLIGTLLGIGVVFLIEWLTVAIKKENQNKNQLEQSI